MSLSLSAVLKAPPFVAPSSITLSRLVETLGIESRVLVVRDAEINNLGMFRTLGERLLVVYYNEDYREQFDEERQRFSAVLTTSDMADTIPQSLGMLVSEKPLEDFFAIHRALAETAHPLYVSKPQSSVISEAAQIHPTAYVADHDVWIGADTVVEPNATILPRTYIGTGSYICAGVTLGSRGFEFRKEGGRTRFVPHVGGVAIGDDVVLQANTAVARSIFKGASVIGDRSRSDQLVHVAHGVVVGEDVSLVSSANIAGTSRIGDRTWIGPNATVSNSTYIGSDCWVALGATIVRDMADGERYGGPFSRRMP